MNNIDLIVVDDGTKFAVDNSHLTEWLLDIGPFFDRFKESKLSILASTDPMVQAIVRDCQTRKWIDLKRPDVAQALDILITKTLITTELKDQILNSVVLPDENLALKKTYF